MTQTHTSSSPVLAALKRFYAAEERYVASGGQDFDEVASAVHPDILVVTPESLPYGGEWRGVAGFQRFLQGFGAAWYELEVLDPTVVEFGDDAVIVLLTMQAKSRRTGEILRTQLCQLNRIRDGLLAEVRPFYWDTVEANRVLGHA